MARGCKKMTAPARAGVTTVCVCVKKKDPRERVIDDLLFSPSASTKKQNHQRLFVFFTPLRRSI